MGAFMIKIEQDASSGQLSEAHHDRVDRAGVFRVAPMEIACTKCGAGPGRGCVDVNNAVLHELRSSSALGLTLDEIHQRLGFRPPSDALFELEAAGRVLCVGGNGGLYRLTACQRALDEANVRHHDEVLALGQSICSITAERDKAEMERNRYRALSDQWLSDVRLALGLSTEQATLPGVREAAEKARLWDDLGVTPRRLEELEEAEANVGLWTSKAMALKAENERLLAILGARALSAIGAALEAHADVDNNHTR